MKDKKTVYFLVFIIALVLVGLVLNHFFIYWGIPNICTVAYWDEIPNYCYRGTLLFEIKIENLMSAFFIDGIMIVLGFLAVKKHQQKAS
ncbi:hypothetical protein L6260_01515 [Candidatus Parcubacteria bacterium]|nr:hypothetical protein [Candidatus Parcubacteria bacterium]